MFTASRKVCMPSLHNPCQYSNSANVLRIQRQGELIVELHSTTKKRKSNSNDTENIVDRKLELTDPTPDLHELFHTLDARCFGGALSKYEIKLEWSPSLDLCCAGQCTTYVDGITIELNERLMKFRTRRDLVETLLVIS